MTARPPRWTTNKIKFNLPFHYPGIIQSPAPPLFSQSVTQSHIQLPNGPWPRPTLYSCCESRYLSKQTFGPRNWFFQHTTLKEYCPPWELPLMMIWNWILHNLIRPCIVQWSIFSKELSHRLDLFQGNQIATGIRITRGYKSMARQFQFSTRSRVKKIKRKEYFLVIVGP